MSWLYKYFRLVLGSTYPALQLHDATLTISGTGASLTLASGATVTEFSTDGTMGGNSDTAVPTEKAIVTYVASNTAGLKWKAPVRVATVSNGTLASAYANGQTVDGKALVTGDRILLKDQSDQTANGIYTVNATGAPTRGTDADTGSELLGCVVAVLEGDVNEDSAWCNTNSTTITIGSSNITFAIFGGLKAGTNLAITADVIAFAATTVVDLSNVVVDTATTGCFEKIGVSSTPIAMNTANQIGRASFISTTATSGTTYIDYARLDVSGAGLEAIAGRSKVLLKVASVGNAHGRHDTLELDTSAGNVTGLGTGHRANLVVADRAVAAGTYYGAMAEIFALGNTAALPALSNACLGINLQAGTAMDLVGNAISFGGTSGKGKMIYGVTPTTIGGSIRVLVNGAIMYLAYYTTEGA